jgi:hypothetical protein
MVCTRRDPESLSPDPIGGGYGQGPAGASVSERGIARLTESDKACCLMEWNDDQRTSFREIQEVLKVADV